MEFLGLKWVWKGVLALLSRIRNSKRRALIGEAQAKLSKVPVGVEDGAPLDSGLEVALWGTLFMAAGLPLYFLFKPRKVAAAVAD